MKKEITLKNVQSTEHRLMDILELVLAIHNNIVNADLGFGDDKQLMWTVTHADTAGMAHGVGEDVFVVKVEIVADDGAIVASADESFVGATNFHECRVYCQALGSSCPSKVSEHFIRCLTAPV